MRSKCRTSLCISNVLTFVISAKEESRLDIKIGFVGIILISWFGHVYLSNKVEHSFHINDHHIKRLKKPQILTKIKNKTKTSPF